jgi:hypothetical protein
MANMDVGGAGSAMGSGLAETETASPSLREPAAAATTRVERAGQSFSRVGLALAAGGPAYRAMPATSGYTPSALAFAPAEQGYAAVSRPIASTKATASKASTSKSTKSTTQASTSKSSSAAKSTKTTTKTATKTTTSSAELAFLDDPHLSIEDKLFRFMALMQQKSDQELTDAMKTYEEKKTAAVAKEKSTATGGGGATSSSASSSTSSSQKSSGGGGLFGALGDALGGIAKAVVGGAETLAKDLGGPLLAAGCTAVGLPFLAPVALEVGGSLARSAVDGLASAVGLDEVGSASKSTTAKSSTAKSSTSSGTTAKASSTTSKSSSSSAGASATADDAEFDEKLEMMKLQRLVEKQQTMFAALSNVLKTMHESQMAAVNNIR